MKKILFLGYDSNKTRLIKFLKQKKYKVFEYKNKLLTKKIVSKFDYVISFGYRKKISIDCIKESENPIINLHLSYLPYNKGAHPNYWSFIEKTNKGVSIHEIDGKIDEGKLILRKKITFKNYKKLTFRKSYEILIYEIENLFIKNYKNILNNRCKEIKILQRGSFHYKKDLSKNFSNWDQEIKKYIKNLS